MEGDIGSGASQETSHLSWPCASLHVVAQPVLGKSCPPVMWSRASVCLHAHARVCVCVCVCRTEVSLPLMIQFPRGGRINGWKKLEALDYGGLDIVSQNSCLPRTSEYDLVWK